MVCIYLNVDTKGHILFKHNHPSQMVVAVGCDRKSSSRYRLPKYNICTYVCTRIYNEGKKVIENAQRMTPTATYPSFLFLSTFQPSVRRSVYYKS